MKVLIACEFSGIVRDAFIKHGHNAVSCDLLPTSSPGPHITGDVVNILNQEWDLLIGHPPCTYLSWASKAYWNEPGRAQKRINALSFFLSLWDAPIHRICLENPMGCIDEIICKPNQIIHPYFFGECEMKRTCLWLKNLPMLEHFSTGDLFNKPTHTSKPDPVYIDKSGKKRYLTDSITGRNNGGHFGIMAAISGVNFSLKLLRQWRINGIFSIIAA